MKLPFLYWTIKLLWQIKNAFVAKIDGYLKSKISSALLKTKSYFDRIQYFLADPGKAKGCFTNTFVINSLIH